MRKAVCRSGLLSPSKFLYRSWLGGRTVNKWAFTVRCVASGLVMDGASCKFNAVAAFTMVPIIGNVPAIYL